MNKIKYSLIRRIYDDTSLTSDELNMLIYLSRNADDFGTVCGVYYKAVAKELSISHSQFYNVVNSLQDKGYIVREKEYSADMNITMPENTFIEPDETGAAVVAYKDYLNLNMAIFSDEAFYDLKVCAKKLLLALIVKAVNDKARRIKSGMTLKTYSKVFHIPMRHYSIYADKLHVSIRMIKQYFNEIKKWISTYNDSVYTETEIITVKAEALMKPTIFVTEKGKVTARKKNDSFDSDLTYVKMLCRRQKVDNDETGLSDAALLLQQYRKRADNLGQNIRTIMERAISAIGNTLSAAGLNKYISNYICNSSGMLERYRDVNE